MRVHPDAAREAVRAVRHYTKLDPRVGDRFERVTLRVIDRIDETPRQFQRHGLISVTGPSWSGPLLVEVRKVMYLRPFPFVAFYYLREGEPHVLAFAHARRRPGYWSERELKEE